MQIDKKTIDSTVFCKNNLDCLTNEEHFCLKAKVENCINEKVYFINCNNPCCNYKINFGKSCVCDCPVRKEIYDKYKL